MAANVLENLDQLFFQETTYVKARDKTPPAMQLKQRRQAIAEAVQDAGKSGDLDLILSVERSFLDNDLAQYTNSPAMKRSLETALVELRSAERHVTMVDDPRQYGVVDTTNSLPKNRKAGLPYDEARQFFNSHAARLLNQDKSRLDAEEKKIVDARKHNMRVADKLYVARQRKTLGIEAPAKDRDLGLSL